MKRQVYRRDIPTRVRSHDSFQLMIPLLKKDLSKSLTLPLNFARCDKQRMRSFRKLTGVSRGKLVGRSLLHPRNINDPQCIYSRRDTESPGFRPRALPYQHYRLIPRYTSNLPPEHFIESSHLCSCCLEIVRHTLVQHIDLSQEWLTGSRGVPSRSQRVPGRTFEESKEPGTYRCQDSCRWIEALHW